MIIPLLVMLFATLLTVLTHWRHRYRTWQARFGIQARRKIILPLFGEGIFTEEGQRWKCSRDFIRAQLQHKQYGNLEVFQQSIDELLNIMRSSKGTIDLQPLFLRMTLDTTTRFILGESVRSLVALPGSAERKFSDAFDVVQCNATVQMRIYGFQWFEHKRRFWRARRDLQQFTDQILDRKVGKHPNGCTESPASAFLSAIAQNTSSRAALRGQALNLLTAGRDTTASLLSWTFFLLVRHPDVMQKLRKEITTTCALDIGLSRQRLRKMPLRLYPPVPINSRTAQKATTLPVGGGEKRESPILVAEGMSELFSPYALHRRPDLYGMNVAIFRPERWDEPVPLHTNSATAKYCYIPFGAGPRMCPGMDFALTETAYTIVRILQEFPSLQIPQNEAKELLGAEEQIITFTLSPVQGCKVVIL
ncbi:hypothetical protein HBI23_257160 [Parastagonospora nodorum]|nr:hypothetical protein HBI23_257160 [Parastagonospora nodorum]